MLKLTHSPHVSASCQKATVHLRKIFMAAVFILLLPLFVLASHFRYGSISWTNSTGNTVIFKVSQSWRWSAFGNPAIGTVVNTGGLAFGDAGSASIDIVVTSVNAAEDWFYGEVTIVHTYASAGNYVAFAASCCRISTLQNNADGNWQIQSTVNVGGGNSSPVSTIIPIVDVPTGNAAYNFTIPAFDPNGNPLSFRFSTSTEAGPGFVQPAGLAVNSSTGQMTFNTVGKSIGQLYSTQVMIGDGIVEVPLDFIIRISSVVGTPPYFVLPPTPANGQIFTVNAGQTLNFTVQAADDDAGNVVSLSVAGAPLGSTFTPPLPASGNPAISAFSWTTSVADIGTVVMNINAQDNTLQSANTSVTINVIQACNLSLSADVTDVACFGESTGSIDLTVSGANGTPTFSWSNGATTEDVSGLTAGSYTVTVEDENGCDATETFIVAGPATAVACDGISVSPNPTIAGQATNTIFLGYGPQSVTLTGSGSGGTGTLTYDWGSAGTGSSVSVSPTVTTTYTLTITDENGCTATCNVTINVVDARCGKNLNKVLVCHREGNGTWHNICISSDAVATHLAHGDYLGTCSITLVANSTSARGISTDGKIAEETLLDIKARVYPNPVKGMMSIVGLESGRSSQIRIMDMSGRIVYNKRVMASSIQLSLAHLPAGIYNVEIRNEKNIIHRRILKQ